MPQKIQFTSKHVTLNSTLHSLGELTDPIVILPQQNIFSLRISTIHTGTGIDLYLNGTLTATLGNSVGYWQSNEEFALPFGSNIQRHPIEATIRFAYNETMAFYAGFPNTTMIITMGQLVNY